VKLPSGIVGLQLGDLKTRLRASEIDNDDENRLSETFG
jgi:hypothetical protein